jgi:FdhD protein
VTSSVWVCGDRVLVLDEAGNLFVVRNADTYELVQKVATVGISALVAVSAPTGFAIRSAQRFGVTLVGFARPGRHVIYAHAERFADRSVEVAT